MVRPVGDSRKLPSRCVSFSAQNSCLHKPLGFSVSDRRYDLKNRSAAFLLASYADWVKAIVFSDESSQNRPLEGFSKWVCYDVCTIMLCRRFESKQPPSHQLRSSTYLQRIIQLAFDLQMNYSTSHATFALHFIVPAFFTFLFTSNHISLSLRHSKAIFQDSQSTSPYGIQFQPSNLKMLESFLI
jgi:hypothetical protein